MALRMTNRRDSKPPRLLETLWEEVCWLSTFVLPFAAGVWMVLWVQSAGIVVQTYEKARAGANVSRTGTPMRKQRHEARVSFLDGVRARYGEHP